MIFPIISSLTPEARAELREFVRDEIAVALQANRDERRWLTIRECAAYLGISEGAVRKRIARGRVPTKRQGRSVVVDREALDRQIGRS